ncbi:MAG: hypothetical protein IE933_14810 [Sphingomonadales bacterium]|nr:hypothetical protein [Sphingomonadales bacterium]MBD3774998.1 hypothetical protein [Paracoccaceae bacterium]
MKLSKIACAFGKHSVDTQSIRVKYGQQYGRCQRCATPLEDGGLNQWVPVALRDAGLDHRRLR